MTSFISHEITSKKEKNEQKRESLTIVASSSAAPGNRLPLLRFWSKTDKHACVVMPNYSQKLKKQSVSKKDHHANVSSSSKNILFSNKISSSPIR